jgi:heme-degrading monooxygenase HmoA
LICFEIVVYKVKAGHLDEFWRQRERVYERIRQMPGFLNASTLESIQNAQVFIDLLEWKTELDAANAYEAFRDIPGADEFMQTIDEVKFSTHAVQTSMQRSLRSQS